jgi:hypothetical protein
MSVSNIERIEAKIDRTVAGAVTVSDSMGGMLFQNMSEVLEFAKLMAVSDLAVPKHLRGNAGACLSIVTQALEWRMSPFSVANKSYSVNDRLAYESQLIHAVVEARAPLKRRLQCSYEGTDAKLVCIVTGQFKNEPDPVIYRSPEIGKITTKNSPLWKSDPEQQLWYYAVRAFARRFCPDVLLGIYSEEELREIGPENARDITPAKPDVAERLGKKKGRGFHASNVEALEPPKETPMEPIAAASAEPVAVEVSTPIEPEPLKVIEPEKPDEVRDEIRNKIAAIQNANSKLDLNAMLENAREYLKDEKRPDLLNELLSAGNARMKKLKV